MRKLVFLSLVVTALVAAGGASIDHGGVGPSSVNAQSEQQRLVVFEQFERDS